MDGVCSASRGGLLSKVQGHRRIYMNRSVTETQRVSNNSRRVPESLLLICVTAGMELLRPETFHPPNEFLACPAEPLISRVAEPENGKACLVEEVVQEVGAKEQLP